MDLGELGVLDVDQVELWLRWSALVVMFIALLAFTVRLRLHRKPEKRGYRKDEAIVRSDNSPLLRRFVWWLRPPLDLMEVDGLQIERTGDRSHCLFVGPTGRGKSASVATVRCDGKRPWLAVMPDISKPLVARADFVWTAGESTLPIDFLKGTPDDIASRLTEVFRSGGNGVWKRGALMATKRVVERIDAEGLPRSLALIGERLDQLCQDESAVRRTCEDWVTRFLGAAEAMGDSVGPCGVDVAELLRQGKGVVIQNNGWKRPGLKGDVVAFGLAEAYRIAELVPGGFRLIFEEAQQLGDRIDLAEPFFFAGRAREVAVDALVHSKHKLPDAIRTNSATSIYFRPNDSAHRAEVAKALDLSEGEVDRIPDWHAWVEHDGKIRRLVHFPKPKDVPPPVTAGVSPKATGGSSRVEIVQIENDGWRWQGDGEPVVYEEPWRDEPLALPAPSIGHQKLLAGSVTDGTHMRWRPKGWHGEQDKGERHDKDGYGEVWVDGDKYHKVHRLAYALAYGPIPINPDGSSMTVQHQPECPRDCWRLEHLSLLERRQHSREDRKRTVLRKKAGGAGGKRPARV